MNFFNKFNKLKNKNFKTNITKVLSISIFALLLVISGTSYAYLTYGNKGTLINTVSSGNLELTLDNETSTLSLNKAVPQLDDVALEENKEYTFTLKNTGNVLTHYEIYLNSICSIEETYIVNNSSIKPDVCVSDNYVKVGVKEGNNDYTILNFEENKVTLDMGEIWPNEEKNYTVKIWLDVNTPNEYNAYYEGEERNVLFASKINVIGEQREYRDKPNAYNTIKNQVQTMNISYKYINNANKTENGITYNVNDNGVFLFNGTDDNGGNYPIYYYRGNVTNNNVIFGGFCWKIVRTTSTGGTKLIYNGVPSDDGKCNNTGAASQLSSTSKFNTNYDSPADVGYMYGTRYTYSYKDMIWYSLAGYSRSYLSIINSKSSMSSTSYYYGDSVTYSDGTYTLNNAEQHTWSTDYSNLKGYYTFFNSNTSGTSKPSYIVGSASSYAYYTTYGSEKLGIGKNVTYSNGTYTITDYTLVDKKDYYSSYSSYKGYYICSDNSNSCPSIRYIDSTSNTYYYYVTLSNGKTYASIIEELENVNWLYGNDVTYSNGTYTLVTTKTSNPLDWSTDSTTLANGYHYTCLNSTGTCTEVYYITYFGNSTNMYYLTFTGGDNLDSAKTKMFTNTNDSTIKTAIDNWYSTNLTDYTNMLENTIFCNDRTDATTTKYKGPLASKDANSTSYSYFKSYENMRNGTPSLECSNINDRFSLKVESGGTNGYGNNTLTYPVGLLTLDEAELAGGQYSVINTNYYLYTGEYYWLLSPAYWYNRYSNVGYVNSSGDLYRNGVNYGIGVRPAVSLQLGTEFEEGTDGTANNPYVVKTS